MKTTWTYCLPALAFLGCLSTACSGTSDKTATSNSADTDNGGATCSAEQQIAAYQKMITQPIVPPRMFAGVDLANGDDWKGLKLEDAEKTLCGSNPVGEDDTTVTVGWGIAPDYQVNVDYQKATHAIDFFQLNAGYQGTLDFKSRPSALGDVSKPNPFGQHTYSIGVDRDVQRDGKAWAIDWNNLDAQATEMFDALMYTFAPELKSTQTSCRAEQLCLAAQTGDNTAAFGARPLGIYLHVADITKAPSTPDFIYGFAVKSLPSSGADVTVKLDDEGPIAAVGGLGDRNATCTMKLGMDLQSYLGSCVEVMTDAKANGLLAKKALGNAQRVVTTSGSTTTGTWDLHDVGAHPNFSSARFDETAPASSAKATEIAIDVRTGKILNDYSADGTKLTLAATTAIYAEYARTVQDFLHAKMDPSVPRFGLGDAHCLLPADADPSTWTPAKGCTGVEQLVVPTADNGFGRGSMLKPGFASAVFCADPGVYNHCGDDICDDSGNNCVPDTLGLDGTIWDGTQKHVVAVLGGGNAANVPAEARDIDTYVSLWAKAVVKYLRAASQSPADLSNPSLDGFTPADSDITITPAPSGGVTVKYLDKLDVVLTPDAGEVTSFTFR